MEQQARTHEEEVIQVIVNKWIEYSTEHPDIKAGTWLRSFAIMTGMTLGISEVKEESAKGVINEMVNIAVHTYFNTLDQIPPATLQ
jgi:hypothetical protein